MHIVIVCVVIIALANLPKAFCVAMCILTSILHAAFWIAVAATCIGGLIWIL